MEIWKSIPGYEGIYEASSEGRIRSSDWKITGGGDIPHRHWRSRVLSGRGEGLATGYRVGLWKDGVCKDWLVARLIGITFLGDPPYSNWTINHKDGNRHNNNVENLEWLSLSDNIKHGFETGLYSSIQKGIALINDDAAFVFRSMSEASRFLGRNEKYISLCVKRGYAARSLDGNRYDIFFT